MIRFNLDHQLASLQTKLLQNGAVCFFFGKFCVMCHLLCRLQFLKRVHTVASKFIWFHYYFLNFFVHC